MFTTNIYSNKVPEIYENVLVIFHQNTDYFEGSLVEYPNIKCIMMYEDATRKKKIFNWNNEIALNKEVVVKVEEIYDDNNIKVSRLFDFKKNPEEKNKELMKPFVDNTILINSIKKVVKKYNIDCNDFWNNIIYDIDRSRRDDDINVSLYDYFFENIDIVNQFVLTKYNNSELFDDLVKINCKNVKMNTKFTLYTKQSINNTKELLTQAIQLINVPFTLKYIAGSQYNLETSTDFDHSIFIDYIKTNSTKNNLCFTTS